MSGGRDPEEGGQSHLVEVGIGDLANLALVEEASARGVSIGELIAAACDHLIARVPGASTAAILPRMAETEAELFEGSRRRIAVRLSPERWLVIGAEAARQRVTPDQLIHHAILTYLALPGPW